MKNHSTAIILFLMQTDKLLPFLTSVIWIVLVPNWYYEISGNNKELLFHLSDTFSGRHLYMCLTFSRFCSLIGWLPPLSPFTTSASCERNQGRLGSQSNKEYWKGYSSAADYKLSWTATVINILAPHSNDKVCNKNRWGRGVNSVLLTMIRWEMVESGGLLHPFFRYCTVCL